MRFVVGLPSTDRIDGRLFLHTSLLAWDVKVQVRYGDKVDMGGLSILPIYIYYFKICLYYVYIKIYNIVLNLKHGIQSVQMIYPLMSTVQLPGPTPSFIARRKGMQITGILGG